MTQYIYEDIRSRIQLKNDYVDGPFRKWTWAGFESKEEAEFFAPIWEEWIGWGYSPSTSIVNDNGNWVVNARIAKSCD